MQEVECRVLFVGMPNSLHLAKVTSMLSGSRIELHLFPSSAFPLHDQMQDLVFHGGPGSVPIPPKPGIEFNPINVSGAGGWRVRTEPMRRAHALAGVIKRTQPDIIHAQELR